MLPALFLLLAGSLLNQADVTNDLPAETAIHLRWHGIAKQQQVVAATTLVQVVQAECLPLLRDTLVGIRDYWQKELPEVAAGDPIPVLLQLWQRLDQSGKQLAHQLLHNGVTLAVAWEKQSITSAEIALIVTDSDAEQVKLLQELATILGQYQDEGGKKLERTTSNLSGLQVTQVRHTQLGTLAWWRKDSRWYFILRPDDKPISLFTKPNPTPPTWLSKSSEANQLFTAQVDTARLIPSLAGTDKVLQASLNKSGLLGLKAVSYQLRCDGPALRSTLLIDLEPKQLPWLVAQEKATVTLPIPIDPASAFFGQIPLEPAIDTFFKSTLFLEKANLPLEKELARSWKELNDLAKCDLRKDLFPLLTNRFCVSGSPTEDAPFLSSLVLLEIQPGQAGKLRKHLESIVPNVAGQLQPGVAGGLAWTLRNSKIEEQPVWMFEPQREFPTLFRPTVTITEQWLAFSLVPTPIKGFLKRSKQKLPVWQESKELLSLKTQLEAQGEKLIACHYSDPKPMVSWLVQGIPSISMYLAMFSRQENLDLNLFQIENLPHPESIQKYLFPNVTIISRKEDRLRLESRFSVPLPSWTNPILGFTQMMPWMY